MPGSCGAAVAEPSQVQVQENGHSKHAHVLRNAKLEVKAKHYMTANPAGGCAWLVVCAGAGEEARPLQCRFVQWQFCKQRHVKQHTLH